MSKQEQEQNGLGITFGGYVTRVLDGDTIEVEVRRTVRVRLLDCWAAETRTSDPKEKSMGHFVKTALRRLLGLANPDREDPYVVVEVPIDAQARFGESSLSFGRVLGRVRYKNIDLGDSMVAAGLVGYTKEQTPLEPPDEEKIAAVEKMLCCTNGKGTR